MNNISDMSMHEFAQFCKQQNERLKNPKTEGEKLIKEIMSNNKSDEEWLALKEKVHNFFQSEASDEEKRMVGGYTESLAMICSAIIEDR